MVAIQATSKVPISYNVGRKPIKALGRHSCSGNAVRVENSGTPVRETGHNLRKVFLVKAVFSGFKKFLAAADPRHADPR